MKKLQQAGSLIEYQEEFERLGNRVHVWYEEAMIEMFMDGLTMEIVEAIRMFKPQSPKDFISLTRMKDDQVQRMKKSHTPRFSGVTQEQSFNATIKRLTWDEMQR